MRANEVFMLQKDGQLLDIIIEGRRQIRSTIGAVFNLFGLGPKFDGYIAHTDPVKLSYWTEDPTALTGLGSEAFGPPLITSDAQPIVAQVTMEVSVDPESADRLLRILGGRPTLTTWDLQDRFRDELRAKLGVELEKYSSAELRGNPELLRALYNQTRQEMANSLVNFGLRLDNFYISWGLTLVQIDSIHRELRQYQYEQPIQRDSGPRDRRGVWEQQGVNRPSVSRGLSGTSKFLIGSSFVSLIAAIVLVVIFVVGIGDGDNTGASEGGTDSTPPPIVIPDDTILVTLSSSSTKEDWLEQVVVQFNNAKIETSTGKSIMVEIDHVRSGSSMNDILDGNIEPTAWSPGDQSWAVLINDTWQQRENHLLISESCQATVYAPIGFAMWRPMAEALVLSQPNCWQDRDGEA